MARRQSTADLIGARRFSRNGIRIGARGEIAYFLVRPVNVSVLSESGVAERIRRLAQLLSVQPNLEIICADARENFEQNKLFLAERAEREGNPRVRALLRRDAGFLDDIQLQMSTAREFLFACRAPDGGEESLAALNRLEKRIGDQGFECRRATRDDLKRVLSRYFGHRTDAVIEDADGTRAILETADRARSAVIGDADGTRAVWTRSDPE